MSARAGRARGRAHLCACGEERLRLTRQGPDARLGGAVYLWGECGGGVKLVLNGIKLVQAQAIDKGEADRVKALPVLKIDPDPYAAMIGRVESRSRDRLEAIVAEVREAIQDGMKSWVAIGQLLAEAKRLLQYGDFGLWVERNGMDRVHAFKFIKVWEAVQSAPALSQTFGKVGQEKTSLLLRLPPTRRAEVINEGVPVDGKPTPLERVTFRQLNAYVRSVVGKSTRGRKAKPAPAAKPDKRFGLPTETVEAFQGALEHLGNLTKIAKRGWPAEGYAAAQKFWSNVNHVFFRLQDDLGMAELLTKGTRR